MVDIVEFIVKQLVEDKDSVRVQGEEKEGAEVITVKVASGETGKVIGKKGKIVSAIRTIAKAVGIKRNKRYTVEIVD